MSFRKTSLLTAALLTLSTAAIAAESSSSKEPTPPTTYNAISDTKYYPKPELPKMGPAGTIITDPTFGCPILRLTDDSTAGGLPCVTPASAEQNTWNTDSTLLMCHTSGMAALAFRFDPKTMKATAIPKVPNGLDSFSHHDPNIAWGVHNGVVFTYNFETKQSTDVYDVAKETGLPVPRTGAFHISSNDTFSIIFGGAAQDGDFYLLTVNTKDKTKHLWNTKDATFDGKPLPAGAPKFAMHNGTIDESGRYACGQHSAAIKPIPAGPIVCDTQTGNVYVMSVEDTGHRVMGYGTMINDIHHWIIRTLDPEGITKPTPISQHPAGEAYFGYDSHPSWNNCRPDIKVPFATSTYHDADKPDPKCAWGDEVVACATDGSMKVWRFCHTRTYVGVQGKDYNFWQTPRGNISQDGRFFMFTSDWEQSLGKDKVKKPRTDVFIVKLEKGPLNP